MFKDNCFIKVKLQNKVDKYSAEQIIAIAFDDIEFAKYCQQGIGPEITAYALHKLYGHKKPIDYTVYDNGHEILSCKVCIDGSTIITDVKG